MDIDHEIIIQVAHLLQEVQVQGIEVVYRTIIYGDEYLEHMKQCNDRVQMVIMSQVVENGLDYLQCCDMMDHLVVLHRKQQVIDYKLNCIFLP